MAVQNRLYTARDLAEMPDDGKIYELHNGVLVEMPGSRIRQAALAVWITYLLTSFVEQNHLGGIVTGADGAAELNEYNTRIPDAAYISAQRAQREDVNSYIQGAPDLAVEVVSPSNSATEMQQRAGEYLSAGARLVWIVKPESRTIDVYLPGGSITTLSGDQTLDGGNVLPGLKLPVREIFARM